MARSAAAGRAMGERRFSIENTKGGNGVWSHCGIEDEVSNGPVASTGAITGRWISYNLNCPNNNCKQLDGVNQYKYTVIAKKRFRCVETRLVRSQVCVHQRHVYVNVYKVLRLLPNN